MNSLNELKRHILSNINENWSTIEKVRYVYIESGKHLQKHTEFFLTIDDKLNDKLSPKKLDKIYQGRLSKDEWNKMICKTGAEFIKEVLDELKIKSSLIETINYTKLKGMKNHLHHYFLCVDIDGKNIFLTPAADYVYIQNGFCTLRFGSEIKYIVDGKPFYKGQEIKHITLNRKDMKVLDDKIGYTTKIIRTNRKKNEEVETLYIDDILKKEKNIYIDYMASSTNFYQSIMPENDDEKEFKSFSDPRNNWNFVIDNICKRTGKKISKLTGKKYIHDNFVSMNKFNKWCLYIETIIEKEKYDQKEIFYSNPVLLYNKAKALCNSIILFHDKLTKDIVDDDDIKTFNKQFLRLLNETSKHFIDDKFVIEPKNIKSYVPNSYINHKFVTFFPKIINANSGYKETINYRGFSEQSEYIKNIIELMFQELNTKNLLKEQDSDSSIEPIFKRINIYSIKKKNEEGYCIYFAITDSDMKGTKSSYWYKYDMNNNIFEKTSLTDIIINCSKNGKYEILSNRLKGELSRIEEMGEDNSHNLILK